MAYVSVLPQGWLTVFAMRRGVVGIKGVLSGLYLCMDEDGLAFGEVCSPLLLQIKLSWTQTVISEGRHEEISRSNTQRGLFVFSVQEEFSDECLFKENMLENHYTTYSSLSYPGSYLALSHKGRLRRGSTVGPYHISTHFLPRHTL